MSSFRYSRSTIIAAPAAAIAPEIYDLGRHPQWSPFAQPDPRQTVTCEGAPGVGQVYRWSGGRQGEGHISVDAVTPERIIMTLSMVKPMKAVNTVEFSLTPEAGGTRVEWAMQGPMSLMGRIVNLFINCQAMCEKQFEQGLTSLKTLVEGRASRAA